MTEGILKILFFARLREQLECAEMSLPFADGLATVNGLRDHLIAEGGEAWRVVLEEDNIICAVNQSVVTAEARLVAGDEVAFFPPVTGG